MPITDKWKELLPDNMQKLKYKESTDEDRSVKMPLGSSEPLQQQFELTYEDLMTTTTTSMTGIAVDVHHCRRKENSLNFKNDN